MAEADTRVLLWAAAAVAACAAVAVAVGTAVGSRPTVLSDSDIRDALAVAGPANAVEPATARSPASALTGATTVLESVAATLAVRCEEGLAKLQTWSPHPGYRAGSALRGPAPRASIAFESDTYDDVLLVITCTGDHPDMIVQKQPDDGGAADPGPDPGPAQRPDGGPGPAPGATPDGGGPTPTPTSTGGGHRGPGGGGGGGGDDDGA